MAKLEDLLIQVEDLVLRRQLEEEVAGLTRPDNRSQI
jgi:hypothetical protein